jgi:hypothetical protein
MGLFSFLRKDERAIPEPGTPEFEAVVAGTAIPDSQSVSMGATGWASTSAADEALKSHTVDLRGTEAREQVEEVLRKHGIDPDKQGQTVDASTVPGLQQAVFAALGMAGLKIPNAGGIGGGISAPQVDSLAQVEYLAAKRDAGELSDAEFEAQKRKLLGS